MHKHSLQGFKTHLATTVLDKGLIVLFLKWKCQMISKAENLEVFQCQRTSLYQSEHSLPIRKLGIIHDSLYSLWKEKKMTAITVLWWRGTFKNIHNICTRCLNVQSFLTYFHVGKYRGGKGRSKLFHCLCTSEPARRVIAEAKCSVCV